MSATKKAIAVDKGTTLRLRMTVRDSIGPVIITSATATISLHCKGQERSYYSKTVNGDSNGHLYFLITDEETATWAGGDNAYKVDLENADGSKDRIMYGTMTVRTGTDG